MAVTNDRTLSIQRFDLGKSDAGQNAAGVLLYELRLGVSKSFAPAADSGPTKLTLNIAKLAITLQPTPAK